MKNLKSSFKKYSFEQKGKTELRKIKYLCFFEFKILTCALKISMLRFLKNWSYFKSRSSSVFHKNKIMKFLATVGVIGALSAQTLAWNTQSSCPQYSSWDGSSCVCWNGYKREGSYCVTACPEGWELDYKTQSKCVRSCH